MTPTVRRAPGAPVRVPILAAAADVLTVVLALVALSALVTGGFRAEIFGLRVSATSWGRLAAIAAVLAALRHWRCPSPSLPRRAWDGLRAWRRDPITAATWPLVVTTRVGVLVVGLLAVYAIGYPEGRAPIRVAEGEVANLPARYDAGWYLNVATYGYRLESARVERQQNLVFFPAFPALMSWASLLLARQVVWAGVVVSMVAFAWALRYFFRLARGLLDDGQAAMATTLLAVYPFAVFYSAPYSEALFLLAMLGAWWHLTRDERWRAFGWGLLAGLTRPNGCLLSVPLALVALAPCWRGGRLRPPAAGWRSVMDRLVVAAAPGLGMLAYSAYVYDLTGDPFMWIRLQAGWGRQHIGVGAFLAAEWKSVGDQGVYGYVTGDVTNFLNASGAALVAVSLVPVWRRFGLPAAVLLLLNLVPSLASGGWLSVGRATAVLFPVFLWLGAAVPPAHRAVWVASFAGLQAFGAALFFTWRPFF